MICNIALWCRIIGLLVYLCFFICPLSLVPCVLCIVYYKYHILFFIIYFPRFIIIVLFSCFIVFLLSSFMLSFSCCYFLFFYLFHFYMYCITVLFSFCYFLLNDSCLWGYREGVPVKTIRLAEFLRNSTAVFCFLWMTQ